MEKVQEKALGCGSKEEKERSRDTSEVLVRGE
jgi:hypothetical protein